MATISNLNNSKEGVKFSKEDQTKPLRGTTCMNIIDCTASTSQLRVTNNSLYNLVDVESEHTISGMSQEIVK
jgi:hypothetical protein